jgi:hypothetical protein
LSQAPSGRGVVRAVHTRHRPLCWLFDHIPPHARLPVRTSWPLSPAVGLVAHRSVCPPLFCAVVRLHPACPSAKAEAEGLGASISFARCLQSPSGGEAKASGLWIAETCGCDGHFSLAQRPTGPDLDEARLALCTALGPAKLSLLGGIGRAQVGDSIRLRAGRFAWEVNALPLLGCSGGMPGS